MKNIKIEPQIENNPAAPMKQSNSPPKKSVMGDLKQRYFCMQEQKEIKKRDTKEALAHQEFNEFQIPPNWELARYHMNSLTIGPEVKYNHGDIPNYCSCCSRIIDRQELSLLCDYHELAFLGSGFPLYFHYIKFLIQILLSYFLTSGLYSMISSAVQGKDCQEPKEDEWVECEKNWITIVSLGNKVSNEDLINLQSILNLVSILLIIVQFQLFRRSQRIINMDCDDVDIDISDYSVMIKNIPLEYEALNNDYDEDLKFFLEKELPNINNQKVRIEEINLGYNLIEWKKLITSRKQTLQKKQNALKIKHDKGRLPKNFVMDVEEQKIKDVTQELSDLESKFYEGQHTNFMKQYFSGIAFVTFSSHEEKVGIVKYYSHKHRLFHKQHKLVYHGNEIQIKPAPKPTDVFYENLHISDNITNKRTLLGLLFTFLFLAFCFFFILILKFLLDELFFHYFYEKDNEFEASTVVKSFELVIQLLVSIFQSVINYFLIILIQKITEYEQHSTQTQYNISLGRKLAIAQFINTSIINFIMDTLYINFTQGSEAKSNFALIFSHNGLAQNQQYLFIVNTFLPFIIEAIDIRYRYSQYLLNKQIKLSKKSILTQVQAHHLYEKPEIQLAVRYAALINLMYTVAFYTSILPVIQGWTIFGLCLIYLVDKYNLLRRRTIKIALGNELSTEMTEMGEFILPILALSNILFVQYISNETEYEINIFMIIGLTIGILHAALPMEDFNEWIFKNDVQHNFNDENYKDALKFFDTDYGRSNPATARIAQKNKMENDITAILNARRLLKNNRKQTIKLKRKQSRNQTNRIMPQSNNFLQNFKDNFRDQQQSMEQQNLKQQMESMDQKINIPSPKNIDIYPNFKKSIPFSNNNNTDSIDEGCISDNQVKHTRKESEEQRLITNHYTGASSCSQGLKIQTSSNAQNTHRQSAFLLKSQEKKNSAFQFQPIIKCESLRQLRFTDHSSNSPEKQIQTTLQQSTLQTTERTKTNEFCLTKSQEKDEIQEKQEEFEKLENKENSSEGGKTPNIEDLCPTFNFYQLDVMEENEEEASPKKSSYFPQETQESSNNSKQDMEVFSINSQSQKEEAQDF